MRQQHIIDRAEQKETINNLWLSKSIIISAHAHPERRMMRLEQHRVTARIFRRVRIEKFKAQMKYWCSVLYSIYLCNSWAFSFNNFSFQLLCTWRTKCSPVLRSNRHTVETNSPAR